MKNNNSLYNKYLMLMQEIWMEIPLFYLNKGISLRFQLEDSFPDSDERAVAFLNSVLLDMTNKEELYIAEITDADLHFNNTWRRIINQNNICSFVHYFVSKNDPDFIEPKQKARVFRFKNNSIDLTNLLRKIYELKIDSQIFFVNLADKRIMNIYDNRGFDIASPDKNFLRKLFDDYSKYVLEYNRNEILRSLIE